MNTGTVSIRYARALLLFANEQNEADRVYTETQTLAQSFENVPALQQALLNPALSDEKKAGLLFAAASGKDTPSVSLQRFIPLVLKKGRAEVILFIAHSYGTLYREMKHIVRGRLTLSAASQFKYAEKLQALVEKKTGGTVDFKVDEDPDILGGFVLEYDTYRLDASVRTQLTKIKRDLR